MNKKIYHTRDVQKETVKTAAKVTFLSLWRKLCFKWELVSVVTEEAKKKVTSCVSHKTSFAEFIEEFEKDLTKHPSHNLMGYF